MFTGMEFDGRATARQQQEGQLQQQRIVVTEFNSEIPSQIAPPAMEGTMEMLSPSCRAVASFCM